MADISKVTLPDGSEYDIKDTTARDQASSATATANSAMSLANTANNRAGSAQSVASSASSRASAAYTLADSAVQTVNNISPDTNKNVQVDVELTQAEYDALPSSKLTDDVNYWIKDGKNNPLNNTVMASGVAYDNTDSGLTATNVQGAIDELNNGLRTFTPVSAVSDRVTGLSGGYAYLNDHTVLVQIRGTININVNTAYEFAAITGLPSPMLDVSIAMSVLSVGSLSGFSSNARVGIDGSIMFSLSKSANNVYGKTFCLGGIYYVE